jgi:chromate transporter
VSSGLDFALIIVGVWLLKTVKLPIVGLVGLFIVFGAMTGLAV